MLHRAVLGTLERFIGIMIENYAGRLPLWLVPTQVVVTSIKPETNDYAQKIYDQLKAQNIRAELDIRDENLNAKIREHSLAKVPAIFVVGAREEENNNVAIRRLGSKNQSVVSLDQAVTDICAEAKAPY